MHVERLAGPTTASGAGLLLLIASVNVASLLLVRSESRPREIAVRRALGASGARVIRQFVTEGLALAAIGSALGLASAYWASRLLLELIPANILARMPFLDDFGLNVRVAGFAGAIALLTAVLFAITPMFHVSFSGTTKGLAEGSRGPRETRGAASVPNLWCWSWPPPWCCAWVPACSARASATCSRWTSASNPII